MSQLSKPLIRQRFGRQLQDYRKHAFVQQAMAERLADMISASAEHAAVERLFEVGAGSGGLTEALLLRIGVGHYYANDLVPESAELVAEVIKQHDVMAMDFIPGDIEDCTILPQEIDLVVSGAALQWLDDLPAFFKRMATILGPQGRLCFSSFGPENMREFRELESVGLHYHSLAELKKMAELWFEMEAMLEEVQQVEFDGPQAVLRHVSNTGVNGLDGQSARVWTKSRHREFIERYRRAYSCGNGVYLTYHSLYCCMKKRSTCSVQHQPKTAAIGNAAVCCQEMREIGVLA
ncbi:MAG: malonyl-ACP O-methyltransferase BioC [Desulfuromonas sp.]|nr:malonyl-ACP O-methyltransferase BioC [Desulfuromonas sp.]